MPYSPYISKNNAQATIVSDNTGTIVFNSVGNTLPTSVTDGQFQITIENEILLVTGIAGNTYTVSRAQEGTVQFIHDPDKIAYMYITAKYFNDINDQIFSIRTLLDVTGLTVSGYMSIADDLYIANSIDITGDIKVGPSGHSITDSAGFLDGLYILPRTVTFESLSETSGDTANNQFLYSDNNGDLVFDNFDFIMNDNNIAIGSNTGGLVYWDTTSWIDYANVLISGTSFRPDVDQISDLGSITYPWGDIFSNNHISNTLYSSGNDVITGALIIDRTNISSHSGSLDVSGKGVISFEYSSGGTDQDITGFSNGVFGQTIIIYGKNASHYPRFVDSGSDTTGLQLASNFSLALNSNIILKCIDSTSQIFIELARSTPGS